MSDQQNPSTFKVSDDFDMFEARSQDALDKVRKEEKRTMGFPLDVGVKGRCVILSAEGSRSKVVVDTKTNVQSGGNFMIKMWFQVVTPEAHKGTKVLRNFVFNDTEKMTKETRYQMWLDFMENAGLPRSIRENGKTRDIVAWCAEQPREFDFEIVKDLFGTDDKNLRPVSVNTQPLPGATQTSAAMEAAKVDWSQGKRGTFAGKEIEFVEYASGDKKMATVVLLDTKKPMQVSTDDLKPVS